VASRSALLQDLWEKRNGSRRTILLRLQLQGFGILSYVANKVKKSADLVGCGRNFRADVITPGKGNQG
jgi:hypothetical protein